jgi:hypothetical protein
MSKKGFCQVWGLGFEFECRGSKPGYIYEGCSDIKSIGDRLQRETRSQPLY